MNDHAENDPRLYAIPDIHGHAKGEHKAYADERPIPLSARMLFLWFYHACRRGWPRFMMVTDHMNYLTFEDPAAINLVRRALKLAQAGDLYGAAETASVEVGHAAVVSEGLRRGMRYSIGAEVDNDPRARPDAQNIVDAMKPDGMIRSVHFLTIDHPTHGPNWNWPFDNPEFADVFEIVGTEKTWELYMATLLDAVERLPGNIVGHFYVPAVFGHWPDDATLERYEDQIVDACEARGMAIEVNTRFLYRDHSDEEKARYLAAHRRLLAKCKAKNVGVAVGSDAHSPKDQGRGFDAVLALLDECEINELVFPIAGRLARVALRVERKAEAVATPEPAATVDERKPVVRKPRTSDAPARPKESSSKRDDAPFDVPDGGPDDESAKGKSPRPKRRKERTAADEADARTTVEPGTAATVAAPDAALDAAVPSAPPAADETDVRREPETVAAETAAAQVAPAAEPSGAPDAQPPISEASAQAALPDPPVRTAPAVELVTALETVAPSEVAAATSSEPSNGAGTTSDAEPPLTGAFEAVADAADALRSASTPETAAADESDAEPSGSAPHADTPITAGDGDASAVAALPAAEADEPSAGAASDLPATATARVEPKRVRPARSTPARKAPPSAAAKRLPAAKPAAPGKSSAAKSATVKAGTARRTAAVKPTAAKPAAKASAPRSRGTAPAPKTKAPAKPKPGAKKAVKPAARAAASRPTAAKKATAKKTGVKKSAAKKISARPAPLKKTAPRPAAKKNAAKKSAAKKSAAKKPAPKRR